MIRYTVRPCYGSNEQLMEFHQQQAESDIGEVILTSLHDLGVLAYETTDLWMNDEVLVSCSLGDKRFELSVDVWGGAFILAKQQQSVITAIDLFLRQQSGFERYFVDSRDYT